MRLSQALAAMLAISAVGLAVTPTAAEPLFRYCMVGSSPNSDATCTFSTLQQCQMTASGAGFCIENSGYVASRQATPIRR